MQFPSVVDYGNAASTTLIETKNQLLLIKIHTMYSYICYTRTINISDGYLFCSEFKDWFCFVLNKKILCSIPHWCEKSVQVQYTRKISKMGSMSGSKEGDQRDCSLPHKIEHQNLWQSSFYAAFCFTFIIILFLCYMFFIYIISFFNYHWIMAIWIVYLSL